jgi:uncharacterized protein
MRRILPVALLIAALSALAGLAALPAAAAPTPAGPGGTATPAAPPYKPAVPYPRSGVCVDQTASLPDDTCAKVVAVLRADERATTDEIALAIVPTTGGDPIETWATGLFNAWGVGKAGKDNGVLLVIALEDHRLRIATGDGARTRLTDDGAQVIINSTITPLLRAGRTEDAVLAGLDEIRRGLGHSVTSANALTTVTDDDIRALSSGGPDGSGSGSGAGGAVGIWLLAGLVLVGTVGSGIYSSYMKSAHGAEYEGLDDSEKPWWARANRGYRRGYGYSSWGSGSSGSSSSGHHSSGSSGSGGGHSSGGGASGSW